MSQTHQKKSIDTQNTPLYTEEHFWCHNSRTIVDSGFKVIKSASGAILSSDLMSRHNLVMQITGSIAITCDHNPLKILRQGEMILIRRSSDFKALVKEDSVVVIFGFEMPKSTCDKLRLESYIPICQNTEYEFEPMRIKESLKLFLDLLIHYINSGVNCQHLQEAKYKEFFFCLYTAYSKEEVAALLHPIICQTINFHDIILHNIENLVSVNDMIVLSGMGRTQFYIRFKQEFGITAKQWLLKHQIEKIRAAAQQQNVTAKELTKEFGFDNQAQFTQFCKLHFNMTPSKLIDSTRHL